VASPDDASGAVLVVGGTGILRPAVRALAAENRTIGVVSRDTARVTALAEECARNGAAGALIPIEGDYRLVPRFDVAIFRTVAAYGPFSDALVYVSDAPEAALDALAPHVRSRLILVLTSRFAAPDRPKGRAAYPVPGGVSPDRLAYLLLGWHVGPDGSRWHTPEEVSAAALTVLRSGGDARLGVVRPWGERPGH
jgi:hypothetical protein